MIVKFNPRLVQEIESLLLSNPQSKRNRNKIYIPSWHDHKNQKDVHTVYYCDSYGAWDFPSSEWYGLKHLAAWLGIDLERIGGLYEDGSLPIRGVVYEQSVFGKYEQQEAEPLPITDNQIDQWTYALQDNRFVLNWLEKRGISEFWAVNFRLGFDRDRLVIPWFDMDNRLMAIKYRSFKPDARLKYYSESGSSYTELFYNMRSIRYCETAFLIETELDAIALTSLLENKYPVIAKPANGFNQWNAEYFWTRQLYNVLDNDAAGEQNRIKVQKLVGSARFLVASQDHKDLGELRESGAIPDWIEHFVV